MSSKINILSQRPTFPPILTLPQPFYGNNIPKSYHKTRRTWHPNVRRMDQPVRLLETGNVGMGGTRLIKGLKMSMGHLRDFEKAGGVEGCLLSRNPKDFTPFGRDLRSELFARLTAIRDGSTTAEALQKRSGQYNGIAVQARRSGFSLGDGAT